MEELEGRLHNRRAEKDKRDKEQLSEMKKENLKIFLGIDN